MKAERDAQWYQQHWECGMCPLAVTVSIPMTENEQAEIREHMLSHRPQHHGVRIEHGNHTG